jgi:hypothetical protein
MTQVQDTTKRITRLQTSTRLIPRGEKRLFSSDTIDDSISTMCDAQYSYFRAIDPILRNYNRPFTSAHRIGCQIEGDETTALAQSCSTRQRLRQDPSSNFPPR